MNALDSRFYYEIASSGREECNTSGMRYVIKNDAFCGNNRRNISRGFNEVALKQCVEVTWVARECSIR